MAGAKGGMSSPYATIHDPAVYESRPEAVVAPWFKDEPEILTGRSHDPDAFMPCNSQTAPFATLHNVPRSYEVGPSMYISISTNHIWNLIIFSTPSWTLINFWITDFPPLSIFSFRLRTAQMTAVIVCIEREDSEIEVSLRFPNPKCFNSPASLISGLLVRLNFVL